MKEWRCSGYLQEAVPAAQEVGSLHDGVGGEDQLVLTERRLVWTAVDRLGGPGRENHIGSDSEATRTQTQHTDSHTGLIQVAPEATSASTSVKTGNIHHNNFTQFIIMSDLHFPEDINGRECVLLFPVCLYCFVSQMLKPALVIYLPVSPSARLIFLGKHAFAFNYSTD